MNEELNKLLNDNNKLMIEIYFEIQEYFEKKYPNVVVLMEVGSFFEIYQYDNVGKAKEISSLLNIQLTKKNKSINEVSLKNPLMSGFPNHAIDRYLQKLIDEDKYTIVIIKQEGKPPNIRRYLYDIISPSINIEKNTISNYLTSLVIQKIKGIYYIGYTAIDVNIGKVLITEIYSNKTNPTLALDILFNLLKTYNSNELIINLDIDNYDEEYEKEINFLNKYLELDNKLVLYRKHKEYNIDYINEVLKRIFKIQSLISPLEYLNLERYILVNQSLIYAIEYIIEHNQNLLNDIKIPKFINSSEYVYLGNNPIKQLELEKVLKLIDKTKTAMGSRLLKERFFNPIYNEAELEKRYKANEWMLKDDNYLKFIKYLNNIYDLDRLDRKISVNKIHPFEIKFLYESLINIEKILELLNKDKYLVQVKQYINEIEKIFDFDLINIKKEDIKDNIFNRNVFKEIDELKIKENEEYQTLIKLKEGIEELLDDNTKIELKELQDGYIFTLTKKRFNFIKEKFMNKIMNLNNKKIFFNDFDVKILSSTVKIENGPLEEINQNLLFIKKRIEDLTKQKYEEIIEKFKKEFKFLSEISKIIAEIDISCSNAIITKKYKYYRPIIDNKKKEFLQIRHPLIESNQDNGIYVPNDINFNEYQGLLLYGINSAGKSSLMKSLGIVIFMAQSGLFVPAKIKFKPYKKIFTRIEASDNLIKGLSTFAVEMLELKNILDNADENSIVLGDEIAHGTETYSAIGIVASSILELINLKSNFIFATHLHELIDIDEIKNNKNIAIKHLDVYFDGEKLIYNRKLKDGSGNSTYGIEFAKSIFMKESFIKKSLEIRNLFQNKK